MNALLDWLAHRKKAIAGLLAPGLGLLAYDLNNGGWPTTNQWHDVAAACLVGAVGVHIAPANTPVPQGD